MRNGGGSEGVRKQLRQTGNKSKVEETDKCKCRKMDLISILPSLEICLEKQKQLNNNQSQN